MSESLPSLYQQQIHKKHYARWNEEEGRRETWEETVDRYMNQIIRQTDKYDSLTLKERAEIRNAILTTRVMPSMRAFMTAGKALERDNIASYNCAFVAVDHPRAFDETLFILCRGPGVGFSVERQYINKLPEVSEELFPTDTTIIVDDSALGWAKAFRELLHLLWAGQIPRWDVSKVRPAGAKLKTFGGRSSGPGPLEDLFRFAIQIFQQATGRKLTSTECHELMCKIGDIVVVGGVRRSALISLYNPSDGRMANIKSGEYWRGSPHLRLANNSAAWTEKPNTERFLEQQWIPLIKGKSGEPGIINRGALQRKAAENGRRDSDFEFGVNPCVTGDTWVLTDSGPKQVSDLVGERHGSIIHGESYNTTDEGFWETGVKPVYNLATKEGYNLRLTGNHEVLRVYHTVNKEYEEWVRADQLSPGDRIKIHNHRKFLGWPGEGNFAEGWILGELKGDGNYSGNNGQIKFWGDNREVMSELAIQSVRDNLSTRSDFSGHDTGVTSIVSCVGIKSLANRFEMGENKIISSAIEKSSSDFTRGFLRGLFDADGSVQGTHQKGISVRLSQTDLMGLKAVQRMLLRLGIASVIYEEREPEGMRELPDGHGGLAKYHCKANHELVIANDNLFVFQSLVGFYEPDKTKRLNNLLGEYKRKPNKDRFYATVSSLIPDGEELVYDCSVPGPNAFDANGLYVHNCGEIILRSCQFCNLTEVVARPEDEFEDLLEKVRLATILGTIQSTFTDFRYLRKKWKNNCEEERLLGVSITGVVDNPILNGSRGEAELRSVLHGMKHCAIDTNKEWADRFGINQSAAITCNKPSGTVSQLVMSGSGINEWHSPYFIRRIRGNKVDPVAQLLHASGVHTEDDKMDPDNSWVFSWPIKAPDGAITREDISALDKLKLWLAYAESWCEHNPSTTINVKESEWMEVGSFVHEKFDQMAGVAFLPYDDHVYHQAPYEEISKEKYEEYLEETPRVIDWDILKDIEKEDTTTNSKELACISGSCEIDAPLTSD